jgi:restriction endonuclease Mrr
MPRPTRSGPPGGPRWRTCRRRIELVDGARLAQLMLRHGVGVQTETTVTLHQLDEDFFQSL